MQSHLNDQKSEETPSIEISCDSDQKKFSELYISQDQFADPKSLQTFNFKNNSLPSATSELSQRSKPIAYNTKESLKSRFLFELSKISRQFWTNFLYQKWLQLLGCEYKSIQE